MCDIIGVQQQFKVADYKSKGDLARMNGPDRYAPRLSAKYVEKEPDRRPLTP